MNRVALSLAAVLAFAVACRSQTAGEQFAAPPDLSMAAEDWKMPVPDEPYNVREGRALFRHYCATCHGQEGRGDGLNAYNLDPRPRDLSEASFQKQRADEDLVAVIRAGGGVSGLSTGMPPWGRTLDERKIRNLVAYLRVLPGQKE